MNGSVGSKLGGIQLSNLIKSNLFNLRRNLGFLSAPEVCYQSMCGIRGLFHHSREKKTIALGMGVRDIFNSRQLSSQFFSQKSCQGNCQVNCATKNCLQGNCQVNSFSKNFVKGIVKSIM